jgi:hypothetical protein
VATEAEEAARTTSQVPLLQAATLELARAELAAGEAARAAVFLSGLEAAARELGAGRLLLEVCRLLVALLDNCRPLRSAVAWSLGID